MKVHQANWWVRLGAYAAILLLFIPLIFVTLQSFNANRLGQSWGGFTLDWYSQLAHNATILVGSWNTLLVALLSTLVSTVLGTFLAIGVHRTPWSKRSRNWLQNSIQLPVVTPDILIAIALVGAYGVLRHLSPLFEPGLVTLVVGHASFQISFVTLVVLARLAAIGPEQMEAARDLYATTWGAWTRVIMPQLTSSIVAGALLAFTLSLDDFIISFFVSGPQSQTLPLIIYASLKRGISPQIHAISTILVSLTLLLILGWALYHNAQQKDSILARRFSQFLRLSGVVTLLLLTFLAYKGFTTKTSTQGSGKALVTVMIYSEYIDPEMLQEFTQKTGYPIQLELYEAQEEMIGKLQASGAGQYDVIIATDVVIQQMIHLGLLQPVDSNSIPNRKNIDPSFRNPPFDPGNRYSWPYLWGTTGVIYRDSFLSPDSLHWSQLFEPSQRGSFLLLDESRTLLSIALEASGKSPNTRAPWDIRAAAEHILKAKALPNSLGFDGSVSGASKVLAGNAWAAIVFNGDAMAAIGEDSTIQYGIPLEGSSIWVDVMTLSSTSPNPAGGLAFMNYILDAQAGAKLANYIQYGSPNLAARPYLSEEDLANPVIYPDSAARARLDFLADPGPAARLFDEAWTAVKSR